MAAYGGVTITQSYNIWSGSPVTVYEGPMESLREHIPLYERRTFGAAFMPLFPVHPWKQPSESKRGWLQKNAHGGLRTL